MRRGEEDLDHLRTLLAEDCIESAHRTLNARRRYGFPPLPTLVRDFGGELPRSLSHPRSHVWRGAFGAAEKEPLAYSVSAL